MTKEQFIDLVSKEQESLRRFLCMLCRGDSAVVDEPGTLPPVFSDFDADASFRNQRLYMAIDSLPEKERAVVLLFYMEGKSVKEIASITGMPPVTVRSHLFRARKHLKTSLLRDNI